jgi:cytoskeletal protein RodZ
MIVKFTLIGLVLVLVVVIAVSYHVNKEGFDDISNGYYTKLSKDLGSAVNTIAPDVSTDSSSTDAATTTDATIDASAASPTRTDVVPEVKISGAGYDAMTLQQRADLLRDIQKVVRNEILANRLTTPLNEKEHKKGDNTDSTAQGKEYEESCYKGTEYRCPKNPDGTCPPVPDMTQYIKKDAIPCYGCSLDY